ncbi:MAG: hypothetical protein ACRDLF_11505, partial [Solirubrobacteraceae bacterium]
TEPGGVPRERPLKLIVAIEPPQPPVVIAGIKKEHISLAVTSEVANPSWATYGSITEPGGVSYTEPI